MKAKLIVPLALALAATSVNFVAGAAGEDVVLVDGTVIRESIFARSITIPINANVQYAADVILTATQEVSIQGRLAGQAADHAFNVEIVSGGNVLVAGSVVSADGVDAPDVSDSTTAVGTRGGDGGRVRIAWGGPGTLILADGAFIQSGDGGAGGDASVISTPSAPNTLLAVGGDGGNGGDIRLEGATAVIQGTLKVGNGGRGGHAEAWAAPDTPATTEGTLTMNGGAGGAAGAVVLPPSYTLLDLYARGQVAGAEGGTGGDASGGPMAGAMAGVTAACGADGSWSDNPEVRKGRGYDGCTGSTSRATGGPGGCSVGVPAILSTCIVGGAGGNVLNAHGLPGGRGGKGADGEQGAAAAYPMGGAGGTGGRGGDARNTGGKGGTGLLYGGKGGDASGNGGRGGDGGPGGNSGHRTSLGTSASPPSCFSWHPICWLGIGLDTACGHIGFGGAGGPGGGDANIPGQPGSSTLGLNAGPGTQSGSSGSTGSRGSDGTYGHAVCAHTAGHAHI